MEFTTLGKTGLRASVMGLGCGGHSRLGLSQGKSKEEAVSVVRAALDLQINFIDTAEAYETEEVVGAAVSESSRHGVILSTKLGVGYQERMSTAAEMRTRLEGTLNRLQTDYVDILHLHGLRFEEYEYAVTELVPLLNDLKHEGKIRFIGVTEAFVTDPTHQMLVRAVQDDYWDVMMVGFNILNQSARDRVFPVTRERGIGVLGMFAVRRALSRHEVFLELVQSLLDEGHINKVSASELLAEITHEGVAASLQEAAYRYCRWESGMDVVLSGTGSIEHLRSNTEALNMPPLPKNVLALLNKTFAGIDSVSGN
jgi:L-galactose dehydrogenase